MKKWINGFNKVSYLKLANKKAETFSSTIKDLKALCALLTDEPTKLTDSFFPS